MPTQDINKQSPTTKNQIQAQRPNIPRTESLLTGYTAGSMNGGHNKVICWQRVMAGERHKEKRWRGQIKLLTPATPAYQDLYITFDTYFVPDSRIWDNAEAYQAQRGGASEIKITEIPNLGGKKIPLISNQQASAYTLISNTTTWRDSFISSYLPRMGIYGYQESLEDRVYATLPKVNVLPLRGYVAIYNDFLRNKEYMEERQEYKTDDVQTAEWASYLPTSGKDIDYYFGRCRKPNSYYTDYWTEAQGATTTIPVTGAENETDFAIGGTPVNTYNEFNSLVTWAQWESRVNELRAEAQNAQKNFWDIIAEIRGSKKLTEGKVQHIGRKTVRLNYSSITQSAYNTNTDVREEFQVMGTQGAYSYTEVDVPLYAGMIFNETGTVHTIAFVQADTVFETGFDRQLLNVTPFDEYRPDLKDDKFDGLYKIEMTTEYSNDKNGDFPNQIVGYKRKYSELFKLPNCINGDLTTNNYYENLQIYDAGKNQIFLDFFDDNSEIITQKTFQFFETGLDWSMQNSTQDVATIIDALRKKIYLDYTDLQINKNQAIKNKVLNIFDQIGEATGQEAIVVTGNNQIFYVGKAYCYAELPVDPSIKHNYSDWGEH